MGAGVDDGSGEQAEGMNDMSGKWSKAYFADLAERVGASAVGGALTMLGLTSLTDLTWEYTWVVVGVPTVTSLLKGLLVNLGDGAATASVVHVTSDRSEETIR